MKAIINLRRPVTSAYAKLNHLTFDVVQLMSNMVALNINGTTTDFRFNEVIIIDVQTELRYARGAEYSHLEKYCEEHRIDAGVARATRPSDTTEINEGVFCNSLSGLLSISKRMAGTINSPKIDNNSLRSIHTALADDVADLERLTRKLEAQKRRVEDTGNPVSRHFAKIATPAPSVIETAPSPETAKKPGKVLRFWNGRGHGKYDRGRICVAAYSKAHAVRLINEACGSYISTFELDNFYSECWGDDMEQVGATEPCVYATSTRNVSKPERVL